MGRPRRIVEPVVAGATGIQTGAESPPALALVPEAEHTPPQRTPERQQLADAIATLAALKAEIAEAAAAIDPAQESMFAAQRALDAAEAVLKDARPRGSYYTPPTSYSPNSFWGSATEDEARARAAREAAAAPPISISDAKAAVDAAKDALDTARRTLQHYEDRHRSAEQSLTLRQIYIRDAVRDVLRAEPATLALAQRCHRLTTQATAARAAFAQVIGGDTIQYGSPFYGWDRPAEAQSSSEAMEDWSVSRDWREALEALKTNPDAPLPTSPAA